MELVTVRVFGSAARPEAEPDSELLGRQADVVEPGGLHWYICDQVLQEAVPL